MVLQLGNLEHVMADLCTLLIDIVLAKFGFKDVAGLGADKAFSSSDSDNPAIGLFRYTTLIAL